jgi:hypothetical protein
LRIDLILTVESPAAGYFHPPKMSAVIVPKKSRGTNVAAPVSRAFPWQLKVAVRSAGRPVFLRRDGKSFNRFSCIAWS